MAKAAFLLTDALSHRLSVRADQRLRECLDLLRSTKQLAEFDAAVDATATSPSGQWLAVASADNSVTLFQVSPWKKIKTWPLDGKVANMAFAGDSRYFAVASGSYITTYDALRGIQLAHVSANGAVRSVTFSPDAMWFAAGGDSQEVHIFKTLDGSAARQPLRHTGRISGLLYTPDGIRLLAATTDGKIYLFETANPQMPKLLDAGAPVRRMAMSPDGLRLAVTVDGHKVAFWNLHDYARMPDFIGRAAASSLAFDPEGPWIAIGMEDGSFRVINENTGENLFGDKKLSGVITQMLFSPDRRWLALGCADGTARIYDAATGLETARIVHRDKVNSLAFTADSSYLITGGADRVLAISPVVSRTERFRYRSKDLAAAAVAPARKQVAVATFKAGVLLFDIERNARRSLLHSKRAVLITSYGGDGKLLVTADDLFAAKVFDANAPSDIDKDIPLRQIPHQTWLNAVALSHDNELFAVGEDSGIVQVYNAQMAGADHFTPIQYVHPANTLAFSWNNQLLATGTSDGTAHIYERVRNGPAEIWKELPMRGLTLSGEVTSLDFDRATTLIAFGSSTGLLKICKLPGASICTEVSYLGRVVALTFNADGRTLAVALGNGLIHLVRTDSGEDIGVIQNGERTIRSISMDESDQSLWTVSIGDSEDLVSRFVEVRSFPVAAQELIRQSCEILRNFPEEQDWAKAALDEPNHHVCR